MERDVGRTVRTSFAEKRRILQLETLYDLALSLSVSQPEEDLVDQLLERVCTVLDPAAAVAVTRDAYGQSRSVSVVGWGGRSPSGMDLIGEPLWNDLLGAGRPVVRQDGTLVGRPYREVLAAPLVARGVYLGYMAMLDKEERGSDGSGFSTEDARFLQSVGLLAGVALDSVRQVEELRTQSQRLEEENKALKDDFADRVAGQRIIAQAEPMRRALEMARRVAPRGVSLVLRGESGTGKELVAKLVHHYSERSGPLVAVNCGAMPEALLESELFGIESGVATGVTERKGKFELADGGTLFLDEVGDMPAPLQIKLLRVLQEREIVPVGGNHARPIDVRVIAATHRDLEEMIAERAFREDLYYRIKGVEIVLPPLRERRADIPHLVRHFADQFCHREEIEATGIPAETIDVLMGYSFPGNVRELQNLVEAALALSDGALEARLVQSLLGEGAGETGGPEALDLESVERRHIQRVLKLAAGNKTRAARWLGLDRRTLQRRGF